MHSNLLTRMGTDTVSKAFFRSRKIARPFLPLSISLTIKDVRSKIASCVDKPFLKPYWEHDRILYLSRYLISLTLSSFSMTFDIEVKTDIGL